VTEEESVASAPARAIVEPGDLRTIASAFSGSGPAWTLASDDLNVNLIVLRHNAGVPEHVNESLDVLLIGIEGDGIVTVDGQEHVFGEGRAILVPKGVRRGIRSTSLRLGYLTCHQRRGGLWPAPAWSAAE
jgi:quercetin dioxygenase-like cupin family protein